MPDKPHLEDEKIVECLQASYGLTVTEIDFLSLGYDSYADVYRVWAAGQAYFLKVKRNAVHELSVLLPRYLKEQGMEQVIVVLPTVTQELWAKVGHFTLLLYPFVEGKSGDETGLSDGQWRAFGAILSQLHAMRLPSELSSQISRETFVPHARWLAIMQQLQSDVDSRAYDHPSQMRLAEFWGENRHAINMVVNRAVGLGRMLQNKPHDFVLCHADIHTGNLLVDGDGRLFVVDWDESILAPRERDLMFVTVGGFVNDENAEIQFFLGYGKKKIDALTMAYYRYARAVEDLAAFAERVFLMDTGDDTKQDSVEWFISQFAPGSIVEAAHNGYRQLSL